jgi:hypothetical protein
MVWQSLRWRFLRRYHKPTLGEIHITHKTRS